MNFQTFLLNSYSLIQKPRVIPKISSICSHSEQVKKDSLFIALKGLKTDGHQYLQQAVERGAGALLVRGAGAVPSSFKGLVMVYNELFLPQLLNQFYDFPSEKLFTVGVTGTNGKTSFCYILEHLFKSCGWPAGVIGTIDQHFNDKTWPSSLTTPVACDLFKRLSDFVELSARAAVMEVSSIAVDQERIAGIDFNALVFSNFSRDHLDYHKTMEQYFSAKRKLFLQAEKSSQKNLFYLLNQDDIYSHKIKAGLKKPCWTFGKSHLSDFCFHIKETSMEKTIFELKSSFGNYQFCSPLIGEYNVYNAASAIACAMLTGFKAEACQKALQSFRGMPGRLERIKTDQDFDIFIDYAHTPQALSYVLKTLRAEFHFVILVFGCGGNRDKQKRVQMMKSASESADLIFLTTDNPRREDPETIIQETLEGADSLNKIVIELDRALAVKKAIQSAKKGSCILVAGKGHERFQIIQNKKIPFCDKQTALEALKQKGYRAVRKD